MRPNRGFAQRGMQSYVHDFALLLVFLFLQHGMEENKKNIIILDSLHYRIPNFTQVHVLKCLSLGCSLVLCFLYKTMGSRNQHGFRECDDLQNEVT